MFVCASLRVSAVNNLFEVLNPDGDKKGSHHRFFRQLIIFYQVNKVVLVFFKHLDN
jgi:hypothetical protein